MKKHAKDIKADDVIILGGEELKVEEVELSDIGKQGTQKCRIVLAKKSGDKIVIIRPADYPLEVK